MDVFFLWECQRNSKSDADLRTLRGTQECPPGQDDTDSAVMTCVWYVVIEGGCQKSSEVTLRLNFQPRKKTVLISLRLLLPTKYIFDIKLDAGGGKGQKQRGGWVTNPRTWNCCLSLCCFNLLAALQKGGVSSAPQSPLVPSMFIAVNLIGRT